MDRPAEPSGSAPAPAAPAPAAPAGRAQTLFHAALLVNFGWLGTSLAAGVMDLPLKFVLKEQLNLDATRLASFFFLGLIPIYIKPLAGILSDSVPLFGTRRRHYLLISLMAGGLFWFLLSLAPREYGALLAIFVIINICSTMQSTVLGGVMVEVGKLYNATGRLSAQRQGITRVVGTVNGPLGGWLSTMAFWIPASITAVLHFLTTAVLYQSLNEPRTAQPRHEVWRDVKRQGVELVRCKPLWAAAGLVVLVIASPGFGTPLLFYQQDTLKFSKEFIGGLGSVAAVGAVVGTIIYGSICRFFNLRQLLALSIVFHAVMTLWYLAYRSETSAVIVTAIEAMTQVLAILPLYDLAARATPKGSEALGYSLMMSVWNFTSQVSDQVGSLLFDTFGKQFHPLVWINSGTTIIVLLAVPFLPAMLMERREGEADATGLSADGH